MILECCVDSTASAAEAKTGGADRLELCGNLVIGGTTPSLALFEEIRQKVDIRIHVLIRPRFGDFLYDSDEFRVILKEIDLFRNAGADGIVIGCLTPEGDLNQKKMEEMISRRGDMHVTLHRAFDMCKDPIRTLEEAVDVGVNTILTSGCQPSCVQGISLLHNLCGQAGDRITIMAGAGVNAAAVEMFLKQTSISAFHLSGKTIVESGMRYRNQTVSMGIAGMSEYEIWRTNADEIRAVRKLLER